jgi:hypothetical protein
MNHPTTPQERERAEFEAWRIKNTLSNAKQGVIALDGFGDDARYINPYTRIAWEAWQARAALASEPMPAVEGITVEAVAEIVQTDEGLDLQWLIEGGISAMAEGCVLIFAQEPITDNEGSGEVFLRPAASSVPMGWQPIKSAPRDGTAFFACLEASDIPHAMRFHKDTPS